MIILSIFYFRKDDICFRRKKPKNVELKTTATQSSITCKPFVFYEFNKIDDEKNSSERLSERNGRRDEIHAINPRNSHKNTSHRYQTRHQDDHSSSRNKHSNQRSKDDERREHQSNVDRSKRKRSRSLSKDRKRTRRSRSRSKRDRENNAHDRISPDKAPRNQVKH